MEFGTCRSGRIGGAAGSTTFGKSSRREHPGRRSRGGNPHPFGDQKAISRDAQAGMVVEAAPSAALVVPKSELLLELLIIALDTPPELGEFNHALEVNVLRQGRERFLRWLLLALRPLDQ